MNKTSISTVIVLTVLTVRTVYKSGILTTGNLASNGCGFSLATFSLCLSLQRQRVLIMHVCSASCVVCQLILNFIFVDSVCLHNWGQSMFSGRQRIYLVQSECFCLLVHVCRIAYSLFTESEAARAWSCTHGCVCVKSPHMCWSTCIIFGHVMSVHLPVPTLHHQHELGAANMLTVFVLVHLEANFWSHQEERRPHANRGATVDGWGVAFKVGWWLELVWTGGKCCSISGSVSRRHKIINRVFIAEPQSSVSRGLPARSQQWLMVPMRRGRRLCSAGVGGWWETAETVDMARLSEPPALPPSLSSPQGLPPDNAPARVIPQISVSTHSVGSCLAQLLPRAERVLKVSAGHSVQTHWDMCRCKLWKPLVLVSFQTAGGFTATILTSSLFIHSRHLKGRTSRVLGCRNTLRQDINFFLCPTTLLQLLFERY